jgi:hypothetical protein
MRGLAGIAVLAAVSVGSAVLEKPPVPPTPDPVVEFIKPTKPPRRRLPPAERAPVIAVERKPLLEFVPLPRPRPEAVPLPR